MEQIKRIRRAVFGGLWLLVACGAAAAPPALAQGDRPGEYDYYVLALSWTAAWCAAEGDARDAPRCEPGQALGFTLHGLWPQREADWPADCPLATRDPSRAETRAVADIYGSAGLAWYQWKRHGRCSGLDPADYFEAARAAFEAVRRPEILRRVDRRLRLDPDVVEAAFLEVNQELGEDGVIVTCRDGVVREVRICLSRDLSPRSCSRSVGRACRGSAAFLPMR